MVMIAIVVIAFVIGLLVVAAVVGLFLRDDHRVARAATLPAPPDAVWAVVADLDAHPSWRPDLEKLERLDPIDGKPAFREHTRQGVVRFVLDEERAPSDAAPGRRVTRIADTHLPYDGRWIVSIAPAAGGARVTVTEDGRVKNPLFRTMSRTVYSLSATQEAWLRALAKRLGATTVTIEPAEPES